MIDMSAFVVFINIATQNYTKKIITVRNGTIKIKKISGIINQTE
jgi:hypothetical protein